MSTVRPATTADLPAIGRSLAAAFDGDPIWGWLTAPGADWAQRGSAFFRAEAKMQMGGHGTVLVDDEGRGAAIWGQPGHWRVSLTDTLKLTPASLMLFRTRTVRSLQLLSRIEKVHPREPHWYLAYLGTDPQHQGHGIGGKLIREITDRADREGMPAYLESSKESNIPFYRQHGFEVTERIDVKGGTAAGGASMWPMWRDPQPVTEP
jgi:ribosomal protein S18 acetylase RimI-like enzyme